MYIKLLRNVFRLGYVTCSLDVKAPRSILIPRNASYLFTYVVLCYF